MNQVERDNGMSLVATFVFEEINMKLRSTYEVKVRTFLKITIYSDSFCVPQRMQDTSSSSFSCGNEYHFCL